MKVHLGNYPARRGKKRLVRVTIDPWDTCAMYSDLALIILPMLKQLRKSESRAFPVSLLSEEDKVGRMTGEREAEIENLWKEIQDKMIFSFQQAVNDENDDPVGLLYEKYPRPPGLKINHKFMDWVPKEELEEMLRAQKVYAKRKKEGFELFGKYFTSLWG
jgi:hypothetical protein